MKCLLCYCATTALVWQNVINSPVGARLRDARTTDDTPPDKEFCLGTTGTCLVEKPCAPSSR